MDGTAANGVAENLKTEDGDDFRTWFSGSRMLNDDGGPLIVHHFTYNEFAPADFDRLWAARYFKRDPEGIDTVGFWFSDNPAARYVNPDWGGRRMDVVLAIRRPLYLDDEEKKDAWSQLRGMVREAGGSTAFRESLQRRGYDGVVLCGTFLDGCRQNVILALDPSQIRSAKPLC